jgi:polysaccharide deacetylase family protein (PEP-CTERM system associated)
MQEASDRAAPDGRPLNAFTVDVEDYFHVQAFAKTIDRSNWGEYSSRVVENTRAVLRLLEAAQVPATFFILGWVADRCPQLVREIHGAGHEIGCHSYWHRLIYEMTPEEFRDDLRQATESIGSLTGEPVTAFRAPCFSITRDSLWALDILAEEGYRYDSSIFPVYHDHYGIPNAQRFPHRIDSRAGTLSEFPPTVFRFWKFNLPVAGGGYFRLYPLSLSLYCLGRINRDLKQPFMFYIHPWELDPDQPRLAASLKSRFRHYQNLRTTAPKLERLLATFRFGTLTGSLDELSQRTSNVNETGARAQPARAPGTESPTTLFSPVR